MSTRGLRLVAAAALSLAMCGGAQALVTTSYVAFRFQDHVMPFFSRNLAFAKSGK